MITYSKAFTISHKLAEPNYLIVSEPCTDDMRMMIDDIRRVEPINTIPRKIVSDIAKLIAAELDRRFLTALRG